MTTTTVIRCRGIGEAATGRTLLHDVTDRLPAEKYTAIELPWSAQYGPVPRPDGQSFTNALADGRRMLLDAIRDAEHPVILLGYSGGAMLAGNTAAEISNAASEIGSTADGWRELKAKIAAVGLVADPGQPAGVASNNTWGVTNSRSIPGILTRWVWDERDPIPCAPPRSPLRTIADQSAAMSLADPYAWGADLLDRLRRGRWQPSAWDWLDLVGTFQRYGHAIEQAQFYLTGGHVSAYLGEPLESLTRWLMDETR